MGTTASATGPAVIDNRPGNPDQAPASEVLRTEQLNAAASKADTGPRNGREFFARVGRSLSSPAVIEDIISILEHFGVIPSPDSHAPIGRNAQASASTNDQAGAGGNNQ